MAKSRLINVVYASQALLPKASAARLPYPLNAAKFAAPFGSWPLTFQYLGQSPQK
jgi:hypothetical protein